jgi:hypothetical protein
VIHNVLDDREQLQRLTDLCKKNGRDRAVVPAFYCCSRTYFGFRDAASSGPNIEQQFTVEMFSRLTCPKCQAAKLFVAQLRHRWPALRFENHDVDQNASARTQWESLCRSSGAVPGLPTFRFAGQTIIGYQSDATTGKQLDELIERVSGFPIPSRVPPASDCSSTFHFPYLWGELASSLPRLAALQGMSLSLLVFPIQLDESLDGLPLPVDAAEEGFGVPPEDQSEEVEQSIELPWFGKIQVADLGLPLFTLAVGLIDGFNPCAMWVLVFLLSVLVNIQDRKKILLIAGTFVLVSGLAYFTFMAAWLNLFMLIGIARPVQIVLGTFAIAIGAINIKDFFAFKKGISLSIPESQKPGLYRRVRQIVNAKALSIAVVGAVSLAVVVNMIELLCTAGLPALYSQILTAQGFGMLKNYGYLGLYISAYMLDDTILLLAVVATLSRRRLQESEGRYLKLVSGVVILGLGLIMIFSPRWLHLTN